MKNPWHTVTISEWELLHIADAYAAYTRATNNGNLPISAARAADSLRRLQKMHDIELIADNELSEAIVEGQRLDADLSLGITGA